MCSFVYSSVTLSNLGLITIPDLSTKIRIDDVKCVMQQFGRRSLHMGPMNFRNSSWTPF